MSKREIKKTVISYDKTLQQKQAEQKRQRSRQKKTKVEVVDTNSRRARLAMLKNRRDQIQIKNNNQADAETVIKFTTNLNNKQINNQENKGKQIQSQNKGKNQIQTKIQSQKREIKIQNNFVENNQDNLQEQQQIQKIMLKPVFISKQNRQQSHSLALQKQQQRKQKALRYTTKLLLLENAKNNDDSQGQIVNSSDQEAETNMPNDDDTINQEYEYQLWKIRELKRIRRDREQRRLIEKQKAQIQRRRKMNNQQILLENKVMGSDATQNETQTKYVFMQKYYHKGAFYQDSQDQIFKRDYNLPTPLQMQDKSMLPQILQRRQGNFGKKGQSKYKHLTAEDTTNFDPQYRPDESILASWKKKMAGYKGAGRSNI